LSEHQDCSDISINGETMKKIKLKITVYTAALSTLVATFASAGGARF